MKYSLPKSLNVNNKIYSIRFDYRDILTAFEAINDPELNNEEKSIVILGIVYPSFNDNKTPMPQDDYQEALEKACWFINGGESEPPQKQKPLKLIDWEQDFVYIAAPINKAMGKDIRGMRSLHWWTFLSAFYEIGDCTFAQIVRIRERKATGKKLSKEEKEWYRKNRHLVDFKTKYTNQDDELLKKWGMK